MSQSAQRHQPKPLRKERRTKSFEQVTQEGLRSACDILQGYIYSKPINANTYRAAATAVTLSREDKQKIGHGVDYNAVLTAALDCLIGSGLVAHTGQLFHRPSSNAT